MHSKHLIILIMVILVFLAIIAVLFPQQKIGDSSSETDDLVATSAIERTAEEIQDFLQNETASFVIDTQTQTVTMSGSSVLIEYAAQRGDNGCLYTINWGDDSRIDTNHVMCENALRHRYLEPGEYEVVVRLFAMQDGTPTTVWSDTITIDTTISSGPDEGTTAPSVTNETQDIDQ